MAVKKWRGKWSVDFEVDGKRIRRVSPVQNKRGAREFERELRLELETTPKAPERVEAPRLADFADEWLAAYVAVHNKPSTMVRNRTIFRRHLIPFFGNRRLDEIDGRAIEAFKGDRRAVGLNNGTINTHLTVLHKMMRTAQEWGRLGDVPRVRLLPYEQGDFDWLRPAEAGALLDAAEGMGGRWYTLFLLALRTGMRRGEIFALHWREVDFDARQITVKHTEWRGGVVSTKSGKVRVVPMAADLVAALRRWRERCRGALVFPNRDGRIMRRTGNANRALRRALSRAGLRHVRFHDLRHTFASHLVLKGQPLRVVQLLMGHHSVTVTERYAHVGDEQLAAAVDVLDGLGTVDAAPREAQE